MSLKLYLHYTEVWNVCDAVAVVLFVAGCVLRFVPSPDVHMAKVLYSLAVAIW